MDPASQQNLWQTFFNLGGIAGALSLIWQMANTIREQYRKPRLEISELVQNKDIFNVKIEPPAEPDERRYVTVQVKNGGRRYARGCVARARATPLSGVGEAKEVTLHWADAPVMYRTTGESHVDIAPGGSMWRSREESAGLGWQVTPHSMGITTPTRSLCQARTSSRSE